jgi:hypothetical protein
MSISTVTASATALESLAHRLNTATVSELRAALTNCPAQEMALAMLLLPLERSNAALARVEHARIKDALALTRDELASSEDTARRLARRLEAAAREPGGGLLALIDFVARRLGVLVREPGSDAVR